MSMYFFRISHGRYSGAADQGSEFASPEDAWAEMTKVCANLLGGISRQSAGLQAQTDWIPMPGKRLFVPPPLPRLKLILHCEKETKDAGRLRL